MCGNTKIADIRFRIYVVTRAVVAMAYPPSTVPALQRFNNNMRESIPAGAVVPFDLQHNDLHQGNVLLADITRADPEHDISPILKVGFPALPRNCSVEID